VKRRASKDLALELELELELELAVLELAVARLRARPVWLILLGIPSVFLPLTLLFVTPPRGSAH